VIFSTLSKSIGLIPSNGNGSIGCGVGSVWSGRLSISPLPVIVTVVSAVLFSINPFTTSRAVIVGAP